MSDAVLAVVFAVFIWWFSTGVVLILNRMSVNAMRLSQVASSALALTALVGLVHASRLQGIAGAYCAFTSALLIWGWNELSFLSGWITGPRTTELPPGTTGWARFMASVEVVLWHELGILFTGLAVVGLTWGAPNQVGTATYLVLWVMRTSAKLNLFFGVRNLSEAFLPVHLAYMASFFRRRAMNSLLPFSVISSSAVLALLVSHAVDAATSGVEAVGYALVGTMLALAILEHLLLVLPVEPTAAWRWAMARRSSTSSIGPTEKDTAAAVKDNTAFSVACGSAALDTHDKFFQIR
jgi:putative photosynthetic complex assembly protein 2